MPSNHTQGPWSHEQFQLKYLGTVSKSLRSKLINEIVDDVKALPDSCRTSGDSGLSDVWEEFKSQVQYQHSVYFSIYEDLIRGFCSIRIENLSQESKALLWAFSDECEFREESTPTTVIDETALSQELYIAVVGQAMNEPLSGTQE